MKKIDVLYYIAIFGTFFMYLADTSKIIIIEGSIRNITLVILAILFIVKILFTKYSKSQLLLIAVFGMISLYITYVLDNFLFVTNFLAIVGIKGVDIKNIVKIDIAVKLFFILLHSIIYLHDYIYDYSNITQTFLYTKDLEIRHTLYFSHSNGVGGLVLWLIIDMFYISKNKLRTYIISTVVMLFYYYLTVSRTAMIIYIIFSILLFINYKKEKIFNEKTNFVLKYMVDIMLIITIVLVVIPNIVGNSTIIDYIDMLLSRRLYFSQWAIETYGFNLLPNAKTSLLENGLIIDNFYIRCIVSYGFITYLMLSAKYKLLSNKIKNMDRIILMILPIYLFNELFCYNIGRAIPLLILANALFNNKKEEEKNEVNNNNNTNI